MDRRPRLRRCAAAPLLLAGDDAGDEPSAADAAARIAYFSAQKIQQFDRDAAPSTELMTAPFCVQDSAPDVNRR